MTAHDDAQARKYYEINVLLETLSPVMQGVMEPTPLNRTPTGREIKVRKVRTVATVLPVAEWGWDRPLEDDGEPESDHPRAGPRFRHTIVDVPVLGANAFRHKVRAALADHMLAHCGLQIADFAHASHATIRRNYHTLYSGGGLTKDEKAPQGFWTAATLARIYDEWPIFGLLGLSYAGNMIKGKLSVGQAYPLVERLIPRFFHDPASAEKRFPRTTWIDVHPAALIRGRSVEDVWAEYRQPDPQVPQPDTSRDANGDGVKAGTRAMVMLSQYIPAGVPFGTTWYLGGATPLDGSALRLALERMTAEGVIRFGGRQNAGMGHLSIRASVQHLPPSDLYDAYIQEHAETLRQALLAQGPWKAGLLHAPIKPAPEATEESPP